MEETNGMKRVRVSFNPGKESAISDIKLKCANLIDVMDMLKEDGYNPRECATAQTKLTLLSLAEKKR